MQADKPGYAKRRRLYGRRKSRPLSTRQKHLVNNLLPKLKLNLATVASDLAALGNGKIWLEIGYGGGEHLASQALKHPGIQFIGCEPFINGTAKLLGLIEDREIGNILIHDGDAGEVIERLEPDSIERAFVLYPDPWPKKRHNKRRFLSEANFVRLGKVLKPGAELRIATDIGDYACAILAAARASGAFRWTAQKPADWREAPTDWVSTRYEQKAKKAGRKCYYLTFQRIQAKMR